METTRDGRPSQAEALGVVALTIALAAAVIFFPRPGPAQSYAFVGESISKNEMFLDFYAGTNPSVDVACLINIHSDYPNHPGVTTQNIANGGIITVTGQSVSYQFLKPGGQSIVVNGQTYDLSANKFLDAYINATGQLTITPRLLSDPDAQNIVRYLAQEHQP